MIVKHFQKFFRCPGAPRHDPKVRPNFILLVSFFDLEPNGVQGASRRCPREPQKSPGATQKGSKGGQEEPRRNPGEPKKGPGEPRKKQKGSRGSVGKARWREGRRQLDI